MRRWLMRMVTVLLSWARGKLILKYLNIYNKCRAEAGCERVPDRPQDTRRPAQRGVAFLDCGDDEKSPGVAPGDRKIID